MWKYLAFGLLVLFGMSGGEKLNNKTLTTNPTESSSDTTTENGTETTTLPPVTTTVPPTTEPVTVEPNITTSLETTTATPPPETTPEHTVTTAVPTSSSTTPMPKAEVGKWSVKDNSTDVTCIKVEMAVEFKIKKDGENILYNLSPNATTEGSTCNGTDGIQILELVDDKDQEYKLTLLFVHKDKKVYVENITLAFPHDKSPAATSGVFFSAGQDESYLCNSQPPLSFDNVTLTMSDVHMQAFKSTNDFVNAKSCDEDNVVSDVVPIAVGCALGALVIIVLIAYLVGRRRSRQKGYQSV